MSRGGRAILVTGGAGFIGSALCRFLVGEGHRVVALDKLTYAGSQGSLDALRHDTNFRFVRGDIRDRQLLDSILADEPVATIMHLAAESHVDRSIDAPETFVDTNVMGTCILLEAALAHWRRLPSAEAEAFRFHHVSTDEVFGDLDPDEPAFTEETRYAPSSPYAASKAASDHLVNAWHRTFGLPVVRTNCSNNYGPFQFPEKLIPLTILNALAEVEIPIYGTGLNVRDWLYVEDHVRAMVLVAEQGAIGASYNIGGGAECTNLGMVETICALLDRSRPRRSGASYADLITFVDDRPGHDRRYAMDFGRLRRDLGWRPAETLESGLARTVGWYLDNAWWWEPIRGHQYAGARLGLGSTFVRPVAAAAPAGP